MRTIFVIEDWTGKRIFPHKTFKTFEEGWEHIRKYFQEEKWEDLSVEEIEAPKRFTVKIGYDCDTESPAEYGGWEFVSFNSRHVAYQSPYDYIDVRRKYHKNGTCERHVVPVHIGMTRRLQTGTAFLLSCYEHGNVQWALQGEAYYCPYDTADVAGILLWKDDVKNLPKEREKRAEYARGFLSDYNQWANGNCYWFNIEDEEGEIDDSCGGFIGEEHIAETICDILAGIPEDEIEVIGDAAWIADYHKITGEGKGK